MISKLFSNTKIAFRTLWLAVWHGYYPAVFVGFFVLILFLLQWIFEFDQFYAVIIENDAGQTIAERFDFLVDAFISLFRYIDDLTPIALILISFFQAAIATIWLRTRKIKKSHKSAATALGVGVLGAGCVACSSSLLTVILSSLGSTLSVAFVQALGDILLVIAVMLSAKAFIDLGVSTAGFFDE